MLGSYRLLLSLLVALSHAGVSIAGVNPGICAVISFYLLSGQSTSLLIRYSYMGQERIVPFYVDRLLRLFPQFLLYSLLAGIVLITVSVSSPYTIAFTPMKVFLNLLMLPQGYLFAHTLEGAQLLPQSWALGLQLSFYLAVPWLLLWFPGPQLYLTGLASMAVFLLAYVGLVNTDAVGYRLLPGTFFMFLAGMAFADDRLFARRYRIAVLAFALLLCGGMLLDPRLHGLPFNREVLLGLVLGILVISAIRNTRSGSLDRACGAWPTASSSTTFCSSGFFRRSPEKRVSLAPGCCCCWPPPWCWPGAPTWVWSAPSTNGVGRVAAGWRQPPDSDLLLCACGCTSPGSGSLPPAARLASRRTALAPGALAPPGPATAGLIPARHPLAEGPAAPVRGPSWRGGRLKPGLRVKFPWRLEVGHHCWLGEDVWIDNLAPVLLGDRVCLSQGVYLCTGNHDFRTPMFQLRVQPITIDHDTWIAARAVLAPGTCVGVGAVVALAAVVKGVVPAGSIMAGNPARAVGRR